MNFLYFVVPVPFLVLSFPLGKRHHPATSILLIHSALVLAAIVIRSYFTHTQPHLPSLAQSAATLAPRKSRKQWAAFLATRWATSFLEPGRFLVSGDWLNVWRSWQKQNQEPENLGSNFFVRMCSWFGEFFVEMKHGHLHMLQISLVVHKNCACLQLSSLHNFEGV